jgi:glycosyltransferase involved in cell wall biosynthesis
VPYRVAHIELSEPLEDIRLDAEQDGVGLVARWRDRPIGFEMFPVEPGGLLSAAELRKLADRCFASAVLTAEVEAALPPVQSSSVNPTLSIVICTKDRPQRVARLLESLQGTVSDPLFRSVEVVVVDNASSTPATREAAASFPDVRYAFEARTGLNFARNAAIEAARGEVIAYLDDDVVVDRRWLQGLANAWRSRPDAGGFTGLVLPFRLDTEAQLTFEGLGGFGRGFKRLEYREERLGNPLHPVGTGMLGAGANMAFDRQLLIDLGGFDEALDTGAPLPGGGDLDIFYRVLRSGRPMIYEPQYAVYHEHRETWPELRRQYWSWGLGLMAFLTKSRRHDPTLGGRHTAMIRWWFLDQLKTFRKSAFKGDRKRAQIALDELRGGIEGLFGGYDRSVSRVKAIREAAR